MNEINYISNHYLGYKVFLNGHVMILNIKIYKASPPLTIARLIGNFVDAYWPNYLCIPTTVPPLPSPLEYLDFAHFSPSSPLPPPPSPFSPLISPRNAKFFSFEKTNRTNLFSSFFSPFFFPSRQRIFIHYFYPTRVLAGVSSLVFALIAFKQPLKY